MTDSPNQPAPDRAASAPACPKPANASPSARKWDAAYAEGTINLARDAVVRKCKKAARVYVRLRRVHDHASRRTAVNIWASERQQRGRPGAAPRPDVRLVDLDGSWNISEPARTFVSPHNRRQAARSRADWSFPRAALVGMPGVGKSEAAAAYARSHRDVLAVGWWIVADTRLAVIVGLATLADRLKVGGEDQEQSAARVVELLGNRDDVLLVYDNVDDPADLASFLPGGPAVSCSPRVTRMWSDCHTRRG